MALVAYSEQSEYDLVNDEQDCRGWTVTDAAGNDAGTVTDMLVDTATERVEFVVVDGTSRVPASDISLRDSRVIMRGDHAAATASGRIGSEGEATLPVIEEELQVSKHTVDRGTVHVRQTVEEVPVEQQVRLREERVRVQRRPTDRVVEGAPETFKEGTLEVAAIGEEAVVSKQTRVVEEVVIEKDISERAETIRDTVKRTDVEIERLDSEKPR